MRLRWTRCEKPRIVFFVIHSLSNDSGLEFEQWKVSDRPRLQMTSPQSFLNVRFPSIGDVLSTTIISALV